MSFNINGKEPSIIGKVCKSLYLIQQQEGDVVTDPANVAYFKFEDNWFKLSFDGDTVFWREQELPSEPLNDNLNCCLVLLNLGELDGVIGLVLEDIEYSSNDESLMANFKFKSGKTLSFKHNCYDDFTSIIC